MDGQIHQSTKGLFAIVNQIGWELLLSNDTARTYFSGGSRSSGIPEIRGGGAGPLRPLFLIRHCTCKSFTSFFQEKVIAVFFLIPDFRCLFCSRLAFLNYNTTMERILHIFDKIMSENCKDKNTVRQHAMFNSWGNFGLTSLHLAKTCNLHAFCLTKN